MEANSAQGLAAKVAAHVLNKGLTGDIAADGISPHWLQPGRIRRKQIAWRYPTPDAGQAFADAEIPAGRFGAPAEIADICVFLASALAGYTFATVFSVDCGVSRFAV